MTPPGLLGPHSPRAFLARYWQREALLVRDAVAGFRGIFALSDLIALAARDDVESRVIVRSGRNYSLEHGPFARGAFRQLPARDWTLLVQGVNLVSDDADALLRRFAFIPFARLDDVMVSYAAPGGGVGPHFDSYDVFLLQGFGRRRWRYGRQDDLSLRPNLPVKILRKFTPQHDDVLVPGDMLYIPPDVAHDGVAIDACTTYSIGFRAATNTELAQHFLDFVRDRIDLPGRYTDARRKPAQRPARIDDAMRRHVSREIDKVRATPALAARFLGAFLSEPKANVVFEPPAEPVTLRTFAASIRKRGVRLDRRTQFLYDDDAWYVNGEVREWPRGSRIALQRLADQRALSAEDARTLENGMIALLHSDYVNGYLHPG